MSNHFRTLEVRPTSYYTDKYTDSSGEVIPSGLYEYYAVKYTIVIGIFKCYPYKFAYGANIKERYNHLLRPYKLIDKGKTIICYRGSTSIKDI